MLLVTEKNKNELGEEGGEPDVLVASLRREDFLDCCHAVITRVMDVLATPPRNRVAICIEIDQFCISNDEFCINNGNCKYQYKDGRPAGAGEANVRFDRRMLIFDRRMLIFD